MIWRLGGWFVGRVLFAALAVLLTSLVVWVLAFGLAGDPATTMLGSTATPERVARLRTELGLDRPLLVQYADWLAGALRGDLGTSLISGRPIVDQLGYRLANSSAVAAGTAALVLVAGVPLGVLAARRPRRRGILTFAIATASVPDFVIGSVLVWVLALRWQALPALSVVPSGSTGWSQPQLIAIPVLAMATALLGWCIRSVRAVLVTGWHSPSAEAARINGLAERRVLLRCVLPAAMAPLLQYLGWLSAGIIAAGAVIEQLVGYPGVGALLVEAVRYRDLPLVVGLATVLAAIVAGVVALADLAAAAIDPRLRPWRGR